MPWHTALRLSLRGTKTFSIAGVTEGCEIESGAGHCQPQLVSERHQTIRGERRQFSEVHHAQTLRPLPAAAKPAKRTGHGH